MRGTVWAAANQLGVVAGTPAELQSALLSGAPRTLRLGQPGQDPAAVGELARILREFGHVRVVVEEAAESGPGVPPAREPVDLADPAAVCAAEPLGITAAYEKDGDAHGGLRTAWLRAGQALIRDQEPAERALALLAALPASARPDLRAALTELASGAPWSVVWTRGPDDTEPPPPGPVAALTVSAGRLLIAGRDGAVRHLDAEPHTGPLPGRVRALAATGDGTLLLLDERGRLHTRGPGSRLTGAVTATLAAHPGTALAAAGDTVLVGDRVGSVHAFGPAGLHQTAPHSGRVTALAATGTLVCSGGADGAVCLWTPGRASQPAVLTERACPVVALHAAPTARGPAVAVAWADGLVELHHPVTGDVRAFRPGPAIRAVAVVQDGQLALATDEMLVALRPARPSPKALD
ncbi:WD40 repeat domain-containing protein [Streptomyces sp. 5K101]|uniref:WD40 repeat domain-containing protein n=1 Tax=Streptomyces sp. 5K101 TaxID=3390037 RepID=UPI003975609C